MMKKIGGVVLLFFICLLLSACTSGDNTSSAGVSSSFPASDVSSSATPEPQMAKIVVINNVEGGLNVRASASTDGNILAVAKSGDKFRLLVDDPDDGWYQIQYGTGKAYVHSDYVTVQSVTLEEANNLGSSSSSSSQGSSSGSENSSSESSASASSEADNSMNIKEDGQA